MIGLAVRAGSALGDVGIGAAEVVRRGLFRQVCRARFLRPLVVDQRRRVVAMQGLALGAAFVLALRLPLVSLWIGAALFGVPHVLAGVRAVAVTRRVSRVTAFVSFLGVGVGVAQLAGVGDAALRAFVVMFAVALASELVTGRRGVWRSAVGLVALGALAAAAIAAPRLAVLLLVHVHGLGSLAFFALAARRKRLPFLLFVGGAAAVMVAAAAGLLDGAMARTLLAPRGAAGSIVREAIGVAGSNVSWALFHRGLFLYAFGQSLHFAVWLRLLPDIDRAARVPKPLRRALADFRADFGRLALPLLALVAGSVVWLFAGGGPAREAYFALTYFHVGLEAAALLRLAATSPGRSAATSTRTRVQGTRASVAVAAVFAFLLGAGIGDASAANLRWAVTTAWGGSAPSSTEVTSSPSSPAAEADPSERAAPQTSTGARGGNPTPPNPSPLLQPSAQPLLPHIDASAAPGWRAPADTGPPALVPAVRRAGVFHHGVNIDALALGSAQTIGAGPTAAGIMIGHGAEIDLGPRLALRLTLQLAAAVNGDGDAGSFAAAFLAPAVVYRFRDADRQRWIPYVTTGADLGAYSFGRRLLGLAPAPAGHGQDFIRNGAAPSAGAGLLYSPVSFLGLRLAIDYAYFYVAHTSLHLLSETIALRLSF